MTDYCTLADLKQRAGITDTNAARDATLAAEITAASRAIDRWCKRGDNAFVATTATRTYDIRASDFGPPRQSSYRQAFVVDQVAGVYLPSYQQPVVEIDPLLSVTTVATDPAGDGSYGTVWAPTDYDLLPLNAAADGQPWRHIRPRLNGTRAFPVGPAMLRIVGSWGEAATVPPAINRVCLLQAFRMFRRNDSPYGVINELVSAEGGAVTVPRLDPDIKRLLIDAGYIEQWVVA